MAGTYRITDEHSAYFQTRFPHDTRREVLWRSLYRYYFSHLISPDDCVLELGSGYGHFINQVVTRRRVALDQWDGFRDHLHPEVEPRVGDITDLSFLSAGSVNFAFASNLFEHLSQEDFATILRQLRSVLAKRGTLNIVQPNYHYAYREYFDDYTHRSIYTHVSLCDFLQVHGYEILECLPRFLPLSVKSRLPVSPFLIRLYLKFPWKVMGKQMLVRATPKQE